ncbi:hypothetical protein Q7P37_010397 [Cladosporium fusiforme]
MADSQEQEQKPEVTLHWLEKSRSQRILWLLEECTTSASPLTYTIKVYKRQSNKLADPALKEIHPLGKSPVVTLTAPTLAEPLALAESGLIVEYLCEHFAPHLVPARWKEGCEGKVGGETEQWLRYKFYLQYAEGSLMSLLMVAMFMDNIRTSPVPFFIKPVTRGIADKVDSLYLLDNYATHFSFLESQLASSPDGGEFLCGKELTGADILMSYPLMAAKPRMDREKYPALVKFVERLEQHPGQLGSIKKIEEVTGEEYVFRP